MIDGSNPDFQEVMIRVAGLGLAAFLVCGVALTLFIRSLSLDTRTGDQSWSKRTVLTFLLLVLSLASFSLYFAWLAFEG